MVESIGADAGLDRRQLLAQIPKLTLAHSAIIAAGDGHWPHVAAVEQELSGLQTWVEQRQADGAPLALAGDPGALCAATALASTMPGGARATWAGSADPIELSGLLEGRPHLVAIDGPAWVDAVAGGLVDTLAGVTHVGGDGPLSGPGAGDARFGVLSPLSLALCALAGTPADAVLAETRQLARRAAAPAALENPAYLLAAALLGWRDRGVDRLLIAVPSARLAPWARWASGAIEGLSCRVARPHGLDEPRGIGAGAAHSGDDLTLQRLVEGPGDTVTLALWSDDLGADRLIGADRSAGALLREQHQRWLRELKLRGRPVVQLRLPSLGPASMAAASYLLIHAAVAWSMAQELDPIAMPAVARWRERARQDL